MAHAIGHQNTMKFHIETERLILRDLLPSDDVFMFELDSNPEVHRYLGNSPIQNIEEARTYIRNTQVQYAEYGIGRWATIEKSTGAFIGWSGLRYKTTPENKHINYYDVGYRLMPLFWGKGYATESCKAALEYGFETMNLNCIIGTANRDNVASRRALEKSGLTFVEKFMRKDMVCDWLKITREEWLKLKNTVNMQSDEK